MLKYCKLLLVMVSSIMIKQYLLKDKKHALFETKMDKKSIWFILFITKNGWKSIPFGAAQIYKVHIREYTQGFLVLLDGMLLHHELLPYIFQLPHQFSVNHLRKESKVCCKILPLYLHGKYLMYMWSTNWSKLKFYLIEPLCSLYIGKENLEE